MNRVGWMIIITLLASLLVMPSAHAQETPHVEDDEGDVEFRGGGQNAAAVQQVATAVDMVAAYIIESPEGFTFTVEAVDMQSPTDLDAVAEYQAYVTHNDTDYRVRLTRGLSSGTEGAWLDIWDAGSGYWNTIDYYREDATWTGNQMSVLIPRENLRDSEGTPPTPGRSFENIYFASMGNEVIDGFHLDGEETTLPHAYDRMPDTDYADPLGFVFGLVQTGHARLSSPEPFRASNGEATTYLYEVVAANMGNQNDTFQFVVASAPPEWDIRLSQNLIRLSPEGTLSLPVIVQTTFKHAHGTSDSFVLEMQSTSDASAVGRVELGVYYPEIAQPAGHHDTVYFHSRDSSGSAAGFAMGTALDTLGFNEDLQVAYFNTAEKHELSDDIPVQGKYDGLGLGTAGPSAIYTWNMLLEPGLLMGLDFDSEGVGTIEVTIASTIPRVGGKVSGELIYVGPSDDGRDGPWWWREATTLGFVHTSAEQDIAANSQSTYTTTMNFTKESDLIPYEKGGALALVLEFEHVGTDNFYLGPKVEPNFIPGGFMTLPLFDYSDPIAQSFGDIRGVQLVSSTGQDRLVNPGESVLYNVTLKNQGRDADDFRLTLIGKNEAWGEILIGDRVSLGEDETITFQIAVSAPEGASDGERADLLLEASSTQDIEARSLLRLLTVVDVDEDHPDDSALADSLRKEPEKESPGAPVLLTALALLGLVRLRRK